MPVSRIATISKDVPTGRRMKMRDGFIRLPGWQAGPRLRSSAAWSLLRRRLLVAVPALAGVLGLTRRGRCRRGARRCALAQQHLGPILELVGAVDDHGLAGLDALRDRYVAGIARAKCHFAHTHGLVRADDIDVGARSTTLDRGLRNEGRAVQRIEQQ